MGRAVNIARCAVLDAEGRVHPAGRAAFEARREDLTREKHLRTLIEASAARQRLR